MRHSITSLLLLVWLDGQASAHPASGIVADAEGQVFFLDTGEPRGFSGFIWKIDRQGRLTAIHDSGGHFLTLDAKKRFAGSDLMGWFRNKRTQWLLRTPVPGSTSALIQADGSPIVMGPDGGLYYASAEQLEYTNHLGLSKEWQPRVRRIRRDGTVTTLVTVSPVDRARAALR